MENDPYIWKDIKMYKERRLRLGDLQDKILFPKSGKINPIPEDGGKPLK